MTCACADSISRSLRFKATMRRIFNDIIIKSSCNFVFILAVPDRAVVEAAIDNSQQAPSIPKVIIAQRHEFKFYYY